MKRALLMVALSSLAFARPPGAPVVGPAPTWSPPVPEVRALKSGAKAWVVTRPGLPLVTVSWVVPAGVRHEDAAHAGLAALTAKALHECGTAPHGPEQLQEALEELGVTLEISTGVEGSVFSFTVLSNRLDAALGLLTELLSWPRFDGPAFDALKARHLSELKAALDEPATLATVTAFRALYGAQPEGRPASGLVETVEKLTVDDVKAFHAARYGSAGATVVVVGDLPADVVKQKLDALAAAAWLTTPLAAVEQPVTAGPARWLGVEKKGAPQTAMVGLAPGLPVRAPGLPALTLAADVLGGSFTSRLNQNLREKRGYTYGAIAAAAPARRSGVLEVMTSVRTDVTAAAMEQVTLELRGLTSLSPEEHEKAVALAKADAVETFSSGASVALALSHHVLLGGVPETARADYASLLGTTAAQSSAAARTFDPERFTFVLVGDKAAIEAQLKRAFPTRNVEWLESP